MAILASDRKEKAARRLKEAKEKLARQKFDTTRLAKDSERPYVGHVEPGLGEFKDADGSGRRADVSSMHLGRRVSGRATQDSRGEGRRNPTRLAALMSGDAALARSMQLEEDDAAHVARRHSAAASRPLRSVQSGQSRVTPVKDLGRVLPKQLTLDDTEDDDAKEDDDFDKDYTKVS